MKPRITMNRTGLWAGLLALALLQGCAVGPNPRDPFEPFNRSVTRFNDGLDEAIVKPVAQAYQDTVPSPVRTGVNNFFGNLSDAWSFVNNVLQAKPQAAVDSFMRVSVNTLIGLGGVLDWATPMGIERHREDFGKTLGRWGVATGPYLVLPVLGPSTVRDAAARVVDAKGDLVLQIDNVPVRNSLYVLRAVDLRASLLRAGEVLDQAALDKYSFTRDAYLQRRGVVIDTNGDTEERYDLPESPSPAPAK
ncbi:MULTISPECIES: VacJ family lipoprotein [unclassified Polaromonas]|uniref:MlaA family lipoprotein n=1 Tax=unclassified Polaromonas TaxID=2638319 RepID=UPI000BC97AA8|nr:MULTISPECIES: VacJ family lipoprotein [unclassified Polaromonas]OYY35894.1 MAG: ABC transporter [Polaromonas sp. 35-63-35]OYZ19801.1 MAG: ABC transporter [Polaromonas sp. 16-63-31]OYZ79931.1 MAG: ABC transporter [Polaromonas sp. 24-63-21]OZA52048.1 MAG: ABC transporter [Polaromonas sp. 17-63-33]OZA87920.1 MAG: ABC transporter [Polaromonas sp. 39-63-25]